MDYSEKLRVAIIKMELDFVKKKTGTHALNCTK